MRAIITVPDYDMEILDNICINQKISRTAAIRKAIEDYIQKATSRKVGAFGAFKDIFGNEDSVEIQRKLRSEWEK